MKKIFSKEEILATAKRKGIKISHLNDLIGGYRGKLTDWKNGKTTLTESELRIITDYLSTNDDFLLTENEQLLINKYRTMTAEQQEKLLQNINVL